jgi:hypothetical protein
VLILPDGYWHFHPGTFSLRCNAEQAHISFQRRGDVRCADTKSKECRSPFDPRVYGHLALRTVQARRVTHFDG